MRPQPVAFRLLALLPLIAALFATAHIATADSATAAPLPAGTYPVNGVQNPPASFASLTTATAHLMANGVTGAGQVILEMRPGYPGEPGPLTIGPIPGTAPQLGILVRSMLGYTAFTTVTATAAEDWAIRITGSYITLFGNYGGGVPHWNIRATGGTASNPGRSAVRIDGTAGLTDVMVNYCTLEAGMNDGVAATLHITGGTLNAVRNVVLSSNQILNTTSPSGSRQVALACEGADNPGNTGLYIGANTVRGFSWRGISLRGGFPGAVVENNAIYSQGITVGPAGGEGAAIHFSSSTGGGARVSSNFIHGLLQTGLGALAGIDVETAPSSGPALWIHTNRIDLYRDAAVGLAFWGIRVGAGVATGAPIDIDYNSVVVGGASTSADNSAAFRREGAGALRLRNNIFMNGRHNTLGSGTHWAISLQDPASLAEIGHNDYFSAGNIGGVLGTVDNQVTGNVTTLSAWQAAVPGDTGSLDVNPLFYNYASEAPDLALSGNPTRLESAGVIIPGINGDYEHEKRFGSPGYFGVGTAPDIGVDEVDQAPWLAHDVGVTQIVTPPWGSTLSYGVPFSPVGTVKNIGYETRSDVPVRCRILGPAPAQTELYNALIVLPGPLAPLAAVTATFPPATMTTAGSLTLVMGTESPGDGQPANDALSETLTLPAALSGVYPVGAGRPAPFQSLTSALAALAQAGATGPVTFQLVNNSYSTTTGETFPIVVGHYPGESAVNRLTIKPAPGATPVISGNASAILVLQGVDHVTLDGYSGSGAVRNLALTNASTSPASAVLWARPAAGADGVSDALLQNLVVRGNASPTTLVGIGFGGSAIALDSDGAGHDGNVIRNCLVQRAQAGIYLAGSASDPNLSNTIEDGELGGTAPADYLQRVGILLRYENGPVVRRNTLTGVRDSAPAGTSATLGISLGLPTLPDPMHAATAAIVRNADISRNRIAGVGSSNLPGYSAIGIAVGGSDAGTNRVSNNTIVDIAQHNPDIPTLLLAGIYVAGGAARTELLFNSVALAGTREATTLTPACAIALDGAEPRVTLRNNIVSNRLQSPGGTARGCLVGLGGTTLTALDSDGNLFQAGLGLADRFAVQGGLFNTPAGDLADLSAWRAATGGDAASLVGDPRFVDPAVDLHIDTSAGPTSAAANAGLPVATVATDLDGQSRGPAPDIGADEFTTHDLALSIDGPGTVMRAPDYSSYNPGTLVTLTAEPSGDFVEWSGDATGSANPLVLTMSAPRTVVAHFDDGTSGVPGADIPARAFLDAPRREAGGRLLIPFGVAEAGAVRLDLFDAQGRRVARLLEDTRVSGRYALAWDGRRDDGGRLTNGVYWLRLTVGAEPFTQRLVLSR